MTKAEKVVELFEKYNCAQSVFAACGPSAGMSEETCLAVAGAFGGGMGRRGEVCGAVTGSLMLLGIRNGQEMVTDPVKARGPLYKKVNEFADTFKERHGSLLCRELTGCDMQTPEGQEKFKNLDVHRTVCRKLLVSAVELLGEK